MIGVFYVFHYNHGMGKHLRLAVTATFLLGGCLLHGIRAEAAPEVADSSETNGLAYTASSAFDLLPRVERASFHLRRPDLQTIYKAIAEAYGIRILYDKDVTPVRLV